jgi:hypothetical protein
MEDIVAETLCAIVADGETPPESLTDRRYSGNILVRASPALHGRLVVEAFEQGVSLNRWVLEEAGRSAGDAERLLRLTGQLQPENQRQQEHHHQPPHQMGENRG